MAYRSLREAATHWGITKQRASSLCSQGRIPGAIKVDCRWLVPDDALKPTDARRRAAKTPYASSGDTFARAAPYQPLTSIDLTAPVECHAEAAAGFAGNRRRALVCAYYRGDFESIRHRIRSEDFAIGSPSLPSALCLGIATAISLGDYAGYTEFDGRIDEACTALDKLGVPPDADERLALEMPRAMAAVSMGVSQMVPAWLRACDFGRFDTPVRSNLVYYHCKYLQLSGAYETLLAEARTALLLDVHEGVTQNDIYLPLLCALAENHLGNVEAARSWVIRAADVALPLGFITPFAENISNIGGQMEAALTKRYPAEMERIICQWRTTTVNWIGFHNRFAQDNLIDILTLNESHIALLAARGCSNSQIAERLGISVSSVKKTLSHIYAKLLITRREQLRAFTAGNLA